MKLNPVILGIVIILGVYVGLNVNKSENKLTFSSNDTSSVITQDSKKSSPTTSVMTSNEQSSTNDITPDYLITYFKDNGFSFLPTANLKNTDVYTGELKVPNSQVTIRVDIHEERKYKKISLIEYTIDASYYITYDKNNQQKMANQLDKLALNTFVSFASIPYKTSEPEKAKEFVKTNVTLANQQGKVFTTKIGDGTFNIYGNPLIRFMEIDFGYSNYSIN